MSKRAAAIGLGAGLVGGLALGWALCMAAASMALMDSCVGGAL